MKKIFVTMLTVFLAVSMGCAQEPEMDQGQELTPDEILQEVKGEINGALHEMHESLEVAVDKLSLVGVTGEAAQAALDALLKANEHAFDCSTIDPKGIIVTVAPKTTDYLIGMDISKLPHVHKVIALNKPAVSTAIDTREGFTGFDLMHPLDNADGDFIGAVSILTEPQFFGKVINHRVETHGVSIWIMQKNGRIIYDTNVEEIGLNLFTSPEYADFVDLQRVGQLMSKEAEGENSYIYLDDENRDRAVQKVVLWTTIELHGTEFRLAVTKVLKEVSRAK